MLAAEVVVAIAMKRIPAKSLINHRVIVSCCEMETKKSNPALVARLTSKVFHVIQPT
jgi:hypothetical protein